MLKTVANRANTLPHLAQALLSPAGNILHFVYGAFAVLFLPGAYLYSHGGSERRETLVLAGACWIVAIAFFRGIATG